MRLAGSRAQCIVLLLSFLSLAAPILLYCLHLFNECFASGADKCPLSSWVHYGYHDKYIGNSVTLC